MKQKRTTLNLDDPVYELLEQVAIEKHLTTPGRGPVITAALRYIVNDWAELTGHTITSVPQDGA